jgi:hypothetical protein
MTLFNQDPKDAPFDERGAPEYIHSEIRHPKSEIIETLRTHTEIYLQQEPNNRAEFKARLIKAGRILRADGRPGNIVIPAESLTNALDRGLFKGLAVFADHPGFFETPSVKALIGVTHSPTYNPETDSIDAVLKFYTNAGNEDGRLANVIVDTLHMMLKDQSIGIPTPDIGISLVFWPVWRSSQPGDKMRILDAFHKIDSADVVFGPAADGRIIEALSIYGRSSQGGNPTMSEPTPTYTTAVDPEPEETTAPVEESTDLTPPQGATPSEAVDSLNAWQDAAGQEAARAIIQHAQLPQISRDRLNAQFWSNPEQLYQALKEEREYLAALTQQNVIQMYGGPPRDGNANAIRMTTGLDQIENAVNWIFGLPEATTPEPQLRRFDMLYSMLTGDYEFHGQYQPERVFLAGADTGTLANLAANAMNKVIIMQMSLLTHYRWYERIAMPTPNDGSLFDMAWTSFGGITTLPIVSEGGAYDELVVDDVKEADSFVKYGGYVGITREMIKNSDIQRIQAVPRALASAAVKTRSSKVASIFTAASGVGPTLDQDSVVLFHTATHANLATTAIGTDTTAWRAAALECFKQTEVSSGDRIGVFPKYCLVPPDLYHTALSIFGYGEGLPTTYLPEAQDRGIGDPRPVPIAVPHFTDANDWAYIADPQVWPVIHMSFSADPSGRTFPPPELWAATSETGGLLFAADVLPIKIRDEFAYGVNGFKGIGKRNVT